MRPSTLGDLAAFNRSTLDLTRSFAEYKTTMQQAQESGGLERESTRRPGMTSRCPLTPSPARTGRTRTTSRQAGGRKRRAGRPTG